MFVIRSLSILLLATAYRMWSHFDDPQELQGRRGEMLRLGIQIICGDCCGDSDRPVKTYLDQLGKCGQCGGRAYVLASVCARHKMMGHPLEWGEPTVDVRHQPFGSQVSLHAVRVHNVSA